MKRTLRSGASRQATLQEGFSGESLEQKGDHWLFTAAERGGKPTSSPGIVPALENGIRIVEFLNRHPSHTASLIEISSHLQISKSHCHSILKTLQYCDWIKFDQRAKTYRLYSGILASASAVLRNAALDTISERFSKFVQRVSLPCTLAQPQSDGSFVLIHKISADTIEVSFPTGHRFSADAPAHMRAYYGWQTPENLEKYIADWTPMHYTDSSVVTASRLRREIAATRKRGYARSVGEYTDGMMSLALPIFDKDGDIAYIVTCIAPTRMLQPREETVAREMTDAVQEIHWATFAHPSNGFGDQRDSSVWSGEASEKKSSPSAGAQGEGV